MAISIFFCYAHEDEALLNKLKTHLRPLQRQGLIDVWHDRDISAGSEWEREIKKHLNQAKIILLLVSPDFMNSDYCYSVEMKRALERHERKEAIVIPVIVRPIYWQGVLRNIQALPTDAKPLVDRYWHTLDEALYDVAEGIRKVVVQLGTKPISPSEVLTSQASKGESADVSLIVLTPPAKPPTSIKPEVISLLSTLTGHTKHVTSVAFSLDGQTVASGSDDQTIKLWDWTTGQELRTLTGHTSVVYSVAFSPDGQTLASGSGGSKIKLYRTSVPDPRLFLFSGWEDSNIRLWDVPTGKELRTLTGHADSVLSVAFSPDGQTLASGSGDKTIKIWGKK